eukprot:COSAG01_NODE_2054_length_8538_cov_4.853656_7_plen_936_part_00
MYPTLAELTNTAASLHDEHLDGESLAALFTDPARAPTGDDAAYSQYIRCHNESHLGYNNDDGCVPDNKTEGVETIMGYSVRVSDWRYTAWMRWNYTSSCAVWSGGADGGVYARELYDHAGDDGTDFDKFENANVASDAANAAVVTKLHAAVVRRFGHCLRRHPSPPPTPDMKCKFYSNTEIEGGDLESPPLGRNATDHKACEDMCKLIAACRGYTFEANSSFACGVHCCFLKATVQDSMKHKKQGAESGKCDPKQSSTKGSLEPPRPLFSPQSTFLSTEVILQEYSNLTFVSKNWVNFPRQRTRVDDVSTSGGNVSSWSFSNCSYTHERMQSSGTEFCRVAGSSRFSANYSWLPADAVFNGTRRAVVIGGALVPCDAWVVLGKGSCSTQQHCSSVYYLVPPHTVVAAHGGYQRIALHTVSSVLPGRPPKLEQIQTFSNFTDSVDDGVFQMPPDCWRAPDPQRRCSSDEPLYRCELELSPPRCVPCELAGGRQPENVNRTAAGRCSPDLHACARACHRAQQVIVLKSDDDQQQQAPEEMRGGEVAARNDTAAASPLLLFPSTADLHDSWGLIQQYDNPVLPASDSLGLGFPVPTPRCAFTGAKVVYIARTSRVPEDHSGPIEMFWVGGKENEALGWRGGICRAESTDEAATWSKPRLVIDGGGGAGIPWMINAQNMGRRADTGEYLTLIYGSKACAYSNLCSKRATSTDRDPFLAHGALGFILRSPDGIHWTCDNGFVNGSCDPRYPTTIDHDDGSMTFDSFQDRMWVSMQVVIEQGPKPVLPSGLQFHDNGGGRRVIGIRSSVDGRNWSCVASCGSSKTFTDDPTCQGNSGGLPTDPLCPNKPLASPEAPVVRPHLDVDPPELQFYRARPWRYGDRWVAAVYNYAPSPLCLHSVMGCHGTCYALPLCDDAMGYILRSRLRCNVISLLHFLRPSHG